MSSVIITDDHPIFRTGLRQILENNNKFKVVAEAGNVEECIDAASKLEPDFIITDLAMPEKDGFAIVKWASEHLKDTMVVVMSMYSHRDFVEKAMKCGAHGFVAKEDAGAELVDALLSSSSSFYRSASAGHPPSLSIDIDQTHEVEQLIAILTTSEKDVLQRIAQSKTSPQIATELGVSTRTVQTHRQNISRKLGLKGANSLLNFALKNIEAISL